MNYKLEINPQERGSNLSFKTIFFNAFKINIIERYSGKGNSKYFHIIIKLRTPDDQIVKTKSGAGRVKINEEDFATYGKLSKVLESYEYRNKLMDRKVAEENYINFVLSQMVANYEI